MVAAAIFRVAMFIPRLLGGTTSGAYHAFTGQAIRTAARSAEGGLARSLSHSFVSTGLAEIEASGFKAALRSPTPYKSVFGILSTVGGGGMCGTALLGLAAIGGIAAAITGLTLAYESFCKFSDLKNGIPRVVDTCKEPWLHGALAASGLALGIGGVLMFTPLAPLGMTLAIGGAITTIGLKIYKYLAYGVHMFKYPQMAPWPLSSIISTLGRNPNGVR